MAKDYGRKTTRAPRNGTISSKIVLVLLSFFCGYLTATVFDFSRLTALINQHFAEKKPSQLVAIKEPKKENIKPKFEFYTLLSKDSNQLVPVRKSQVELSERQGATLPEKSPMAQVSEVSKPVVEESKPVALQSLLNKKNETYLVQVAAFNRKQDAEQIKAALVLTGYDVSLSPVLKNNVTWYRVIIGPFASQKEAEKARLTIAHSHKMNGMVRRG